MEAWVRQTNWEKAGDHVPCPEGLHFVTEIVAPPSSSSLHAGLYLGSAALQA